MYQEVGIQLGVRGGYTLGAAGAGIYGAYDRGRNFVLGGTRVTKGVSQGTNLVYQGFDKAGVVRYVDITER